MAAIICDIDDTLLRNGTEPINKTIDWLNERAKNYNIILVTGRPESQRQRTINALRRAGVKFSRLIMNPGSSSQSNQFKQEVGKKIKAQTRVALAIDNNPDARAAYDRVGIDTANPTSLSDNMLKMTIVFGGANAI